MGTRRVALAIVAATVAVGLWPVSETGAVAANKTATRMVDTICTYVNVPHNPGPFPQTFAVTTTVPRRVASGSTFTVHLSVPFQVSSASEVGGAGISGGAAVDPNVVSVGAGPGASIVSGDATFTASGPAGSRVIWRFVGTFQIAFFGTVMASESCLPTKPFTVLNRTPIV